jgi:hypothetical protein
MAQMEFREIGACLRPPRFVVGYRSGQDWIYNARQVIASISRVWGGKGAVIAPLGESGAVSEVLASVARAYDPDYIAVHVPILADLAHDDPEVIGKAVEERVRRGEDRDEVWQELRTRHLAFEGLDVLAEQASTYFSPFKGLLPEERSFSAGDIIWLHRNGDSTRHLTTFNDAPDRPTFVLNMSEVDPAIALMLESRIGSIDGANREGREIIELPVLEEDLPAILSLAITGSVRLFTWNLQARYMTVRDQTHASEPDLTVERFLADSPFEHSGQSTIKAQTSYPEPPIVCVIGETAEDHALALLCDRYFQRAAWIPTHLIADGAPLREAVRVALYSLRTFSAGRLQPVVITSISESVAVAESFAASLDDMFGIYKEDGTPISDTGGYKYIAPLSLAEEHGHCFLADPEAFWLRQRPPVSNDADDISILTPLTLPLPRAVEHLGSDLDWCTDVWMPGHPLPARTAIPSDRFQQLLGGIPESTIRASRTGLTFASPNMGLVLRGAPQETRLAHPLLRFPSADVIFAELAAASNSHIERSTAGRRSGIAVEMWGSFKAVVDDLRGPVRSLLNAFLPPKRSNGDYGIGYEIRGTGYVAIEDATAVLGVQEHEARDTIDRLLTLNVLRRGLLLYCARCRTYDFYRIEQVGQTFECHACGHASPLVRSQWYEDDTEPHWYYSLDQVVRDLLVNHGDVPLLAAANLSQRSAMLWSPELEITDDTGSVEIDICTILDGRIVIGEAKSNATLRAEKSPEEVAKGLAHAAQLLTADEVVLATSQTRWRNDVVSLVRNAVSKSWTRGPQPVIRELTGVRLSTRI